MESQTRSPKRAFLVITKLKGARKRFPNLLFAGPNHPFRNVVNGLRSGTMAWTYASFLRAITVTAAIFTLLQTLNDPPVKGISAAIFETMFDTFFAFDIIVRFVVSPDLSPFSKTESFPPLQNITYIRCQMTEAFLVTHFLAGALVDFQ